MLSAFRERLTTGDQKDLVSQILKLGFEDIKNGIGGDGIKFTNEQGLSLIFEELGVLKRAVGKRLLVPGRLKRIADFGAGMGGSTLAVTALARACGAEVFAFERDEDKARAISSFGILPEDRVKQGDGIVCIEKIVQGSGRGFDLVTAFMLDNFPPTDLFLRLAKSCWTALNDEGYLLVTSDSTTISRVLDECKRHGVALIRIPGGLTARPDILIPKKECRKFGD